MSSKLLDSQPASKKAKLNQVSEDLQWKDGPPNVALDTQHSVPLQEVGPRRRSTRAAGRSSAAMYQKSSSGDEEEDDDDEEDVDDVDMEQLSDSDDDPDFAPTKDNSPEFTYKGRGRSRGRGRGRGRGRPAPSIGRARGRGARGHNWPSQPARTSSSSPSNNNNSCTDSAKTSPVVVRRRGRPLVNFNSEGSTHSASDYSSDQTHSPSEEKAPEGGVVTFMSPAKLHSQVNYPTLTKRQTQAVRLPEGPELTPEQLQEIEAQFKSGDFVMAKKDMELEQPPIWRIDGKSLLQKFQAFEKDGKILYRNISTYSGWTPQGKTLYVPVKAKFIFQSRYDIVVELVDENVPGSNNYKGDGTSTEIAGGAEISDKRDNTQGSNADDALQIPEELNQHMATFEIFLQTLISQALDSNFLAEIYEENDEYFVERVKIIESLTDDRKEKLRLITSWRDKFKTALEMWPSVNIMASVTNVHCEACTKHAAVKLALFYGQPYDAITLKTIDEPDNSLNKNYSVCEECARLCQIYNSVCHRKFDYFNKCKTTVTNIRVTQPSKNTTTILRELLGNDAWITGLFRAMCSAFVRVDRLYEEHKENDHE